MQINKKKKHILLLTVRLWRNSFSHKKKDSLCSRSLTKTLCLRSVHSASLAARCLLAVSSCSAERTTHTTWQLHCRFTLKRQAAHPQDGFRPTDGGTRTSQVSVKVVHPLYLSLQFVPHCFLQGLPLGRAFHQGLVSFRYPLDLRLQLVRKCEMMSLFIHSTVACFG